MFLPAVVKFNAAAESMKKDRRLVRMAQAMGLATSDDSGDAVADGDPRHERPPRPALGPGRARRRRSAMYERIVDGAMADHCHKTNPRLATRDDYVAMLEASM